MAGGRNPPGVGKIKLTPINRAVMNGRVNRGLNLQLLRIEALLPGGVAVGF